MSLIPIRSWRPSAQQSTGLSSMPDVRREFNRLFDGLFSRPLAMQPWFDESAPGQWLPSIDISEDAKQLHIRAEIPGVDPQELDISVTEDRLVIAGEKKQAATETGNGWTHTESEYGAFARRIPLPTPIDPEQVTARFTNGVLTVDLAKAATSLTRKVPVAIA
jgi:HSP20 family protein